MMKFDVDLGIFGVTEHADWSITVGSERLNIHEAASLPLETRLFHH